MKYHGISCFHFYREPTVKKNTWMRTISVEKRNLIKYGLKKTKYMTVQAGKEKEKLITDKIIWSYAQGGKMQILRNNHK